MQNYEIVLIIHPSYDDKHNIIISKYKKIISKLSGKIYRLENWGKRQLSYSIKKFYKAHYILINIQILKKHIISIQKELNLDESILRNIIIKVKKIFSDISPILKKAEKEVTNVKNNFFIKKK
ncbi:30S ribosomal protein S6 [Buchnera aphidicola]|uniref:30S ribosomal protein S6 n=1 Tax=Buchnera aphidicola TaxID=9 RepID=UPI0030EE03C6